jgi:hypothetical protein
VSWRCCRLRQRQNSSGACNACVSDAEPEPAPVPSPTSQHAVEAISEAQRSHQGQRLRGHSHHGRVGTEHLQRGRGRTEIFTTAVEGTVWQCVGSVWAVCRQYAGALGQPWRVAARTGSGGAVQGGHWHTCDVGPDKVRSGGAGPSAAWVGARRQCCPQMHSCSGTGLLRSCQWGRSQLAQRSAAPSAAR